MAKLQRSRHGVGPFTFGGKTAVALTLAMGSGQVSVWQVGSRVTLFEGFFETDEASLEGEDRSLFHDFIASKVTSKRATKAGTLTVESGQVVIMPSTDSCSGVAKVLAKVKGAKAVKCGSEKSGLVMALAVGRYDIVLEEETTGAWGSGRRGHFIPSAL